MKRKREQEARRQQNEAKTRRIADLEAQLKAAKEALKKQEKTAAAETTEVDAGKESEDTLVLPQQIEEKAQDVNLPDYESMLDDDIDDEMLSQVDEKEFLGESV